MTVWPARRSPGSVVILAAVAASAASGLVFEIALTRVFAITQFYHFAFLTVSMALLGFGASGSALAAFPRLGQGGSQRLATLAVLQSVTTVASYLVSNVLPFDSFAFAWDRTQILYLATYFLVLAVPFFFGGLIVAILLAGLPGFDRITSHIVYGANLAGSGFGCVLAVSSLDALGGEGTILLAAALAMAAATGFAIRSPRYRPATAAAVVLTVVLLVVSFVVPPGFAMKLSPYKELAAALRFPGAAVVASTWDRGARIDVVSSDGIRSVPGLSFAYTGPAPVQDGVTFDADALTPIPRASVADAEYARHLLGSLPWVLRPAADTLVLEPRGGLDVLVALAGDAASVTAVERHGSVVDLIAATGASVYDDARVEVIVSDPRTYVERTTAKFDVVSLALTSPYRPVTSGAYSLGEDYALTVEAFQAYLGRLQPDGILSVVRWIQTPPSEETRLLAIATAGLRASGGDPAASVVMLRNYSNVVVLVQPAGWSARDIATVREFAEAERFDIVAMPGVQPDETNRFSVMPDEQYSVLAAELLTTAEPAALYAASDFAIDPPTDDHPFFGHYFKWTQTEAIIDSLGRTWQPFGGAGYLVLVAFLLLAALSSAMLIMTPLVVRRRSTAPGRMRLWTLGYFGLLGLGFLLVEIPLVQQYILLVGDATTAFAVVLFAILLASGIGSMLSPRVNWRAGAVILVVLAATYPLLIRGLTTAVLPAALPVRIVVGTLLIAPLGLLMGIMFPHGIHHLERRAPQLIPWAWAINGTLSVVSAVLAALLALAFGFQVVLLTGAIAYGLAAVLSFLGTGERNEQHAA